MCLYLWVACTGLLGDAPPRDDDPLTLDATWQGLMDMSDVYCKCGQQVGYMFRRDKTPNKRNLNQVGRAGLVVSRFTVAPYQLSHDKVFVDARVAPAPTTDGHSGQERGRL